MLLRASAVFMIIVCGSSEWAARTPRGISSHAPSPQGEGSSAAKRQTRGSPAKPKRLPTSPPTTQEAPDHQSKARQDSPPLSSAEKNSLATWIRDLGAADFEARRRAHQSIAQFGPRARPLLDSARTQARPEVSLRISSLLRGFPLALEAVEASLEATRVDLSTAGLTVDEIARVLERQSEARFLRPLALPASVPLDLDLKGVPLFEALDRLSKATGHRWTIDFGSKKIRFLPAGRGGAESPKLSYHGPLRIALVSVSRNASLRFGGDRRDTCYLQGQIDIEPGASLLGVWLPPELFEAKDDRGRDLISESKPRRNYGPRNGRTSLHFTIALERPEKSADSVAVLSGQFMVALPAAYRLASLDLATARRGSRVTVPGLEMRLIADVTVKKLRTITFEVDRERVFADEEGRREVKAHELRFLTEDGSSVAPLRPANPTLRGETEVFVVTLPAGPLQTLEFRSLARISRRKVPFRFEDIELP